MHSGRSGEGRPVGVAFPATCASPCQPGARPGRGARVYTRKNDADTARLCVRVVAQLGAALAGSLGEALPVAELGDGATGGELAAGVVGGHR